MNYKLTSTDYDELYPYVSPDEIKEEFGNMSKTARWIQSYYKKRGLKPWSCAIRELIQKTYDVADVEVNEHQWLGFVYETLAQERMEKKRIIWDRAKQYEELF